MADRQGWGPRRLSDKLTLIALGLTLPLTWWALYQFGAAQAQRNRESKVREIVMEEMVQMKPVVDSQKAVSWHP
jgi:uncharacterized protein (DUF2062 family)